MPVGSFATYHAVDAVELPDTSYTYELFDPNWDDDINNDNLVSVETGSFTINETGKYLILYGITADTGNTGRNETKVRLLQDSGTGLVEIPGSTATGYLRNPTNPNATARGQVIIDASANDIIDIEWLRGGSSANGFSLVDITYIQFIRLTDESETAYGFYSDNTDTSSFNSANFSSVTWDNSISETDTNVIEKQPNDSAIELKEVGRYLVCFSIPFIQSDNNRSARIGRVSLGGNAVNASECATYLRDTNTQYGNLNCMLIVNNTIANQDLEVEAALGSAENNGDVNREISTSGLFIMKLVDFTKIYLGVDTVGGQDYRTSLDVDYDAARVNTVIDSGFSSPTINSVEIDKDMDVLLWGNLFSTDAVETGAARNNRNAVIVINSTVDTIGQNTVYGPRGNTGGGVGTYQVGNAAGAIYPNQLSSDSFLLRSEDAGDNGNTNQFTDANQVGLFAIDISTLTTNLVLSETVTISENLVAGVFRDISETVTISESLAGGLVKDLPETVTISESLNVGLARQLVEVILISDDLQNSKVSLIEEIVTISDVLSLTLIRKLVETVNISEALLGRKLEQVSETVNISEALNVKLARNISEFIDVEDDPLNVGQARQLVETVTISEALNKGVSRILPESVLISETLVAGVFRDISEIVTITDNLTKGVSRQLVETVNISEALNVKLARQLVETVNISEVLTKGVGLVLPEIIAITDNLTVGLFRELVESVLISEQLVTIVFRTPTKTTSSDLCYQDEVNSNLCI